MLGMSWLMLPEWLVWTLLFSLAGALAWTVMDARSRLVTQRKDRAKRAMQVAEASRRERIGMIEAGFGGANVWLNAIMDHVWAPVLEPRIAILAREIATKALRKIMITRKGPMKLLESLSLEEFTLGAKPPTLTRTHAIHDGPNGKLIFEMDVDFVAVGFRAVLSCTVRPHKTWRGLTGRLVFADLSLSGRVLIEVCFSDQSPGVSGFNFSFTERPKLDVNMQPLGVELSALPGVTDYLNHLIVDELSKLFVFPRTNYTDVQEMWNKMKLKEGAGPGGMLLVTVESAAVGASPPSSQPAPSQGEGEGEGEGEGSESPTDVAVLEEAPPPRSVYFLVTVSKIKKHTHMVSGTHTPVFNSTMDYPVSGLSPVEFLRVQCMDWSAIGLPEPIGEGIVKLSLGQLPRLDQSPLKVEVPLRKGDTRAGTLWLALALALPELEKTKDPLVAQGIIPRRPTPDVNPALLPLKIPVPGCVGYKSLGGDVAPALLLEKELGLEASCIRCETPTRRSLPDSPTHGRGHGVGVTPRDRKLRSKSHSKRVGIGRKEALSGSNRATAKSSGNLHTGRDLCLEAEDSWHDAIGLSPETSAPSLASSSSEVWSQIVLQDLQGPSPQLRAPSDNANAGYSGQPEANREGESVYASPGGASTHRPSPLAPNPRVPDWGARVAALQEEMQAQRECGQAEEAKLLDKLQVMEVQLRDAEQRRRQAELHALIQGAPFVVYADGYASLMHVWFNIAADSLRWAPSSPGVLAGHPGHRPATSAAGGEEEHGIPASLVKAVHTGTGKFAHVSLPATVDKQLAGAIPTDAKGRKDGVWAAVAHLRNWKRGPRRKSAGKGHPSSSLTMREADPSMSFSLILDSAANIALAGEWRHLGVESIDLEIPAAGNGRSLNEWASAFSHVCKAKVIYSVGNSHEHSPGMLPGKQIADDI